MTKRTLETIFTSTSRLAERAAVERQPLDQMERIARAEWVKTSRQSLMGLEFGGAAYQAVVANSDAAFVKYYSAPASQREPRGPSTGLGL